MTLSYVPVVGADLVTILDDIKTEHNHLYDGTGWRDISSLLSNGWTATRVRLIRRGNRAILKVAGLDGTAATASTILTATVGFRPGFDKRDAFWSNVTPSALFINANGGITTAARSSTGSQEQEWSWEVGGSSLAWPTVLPGVAA